MSQRPVVGVVVLAAGRSTRLGQPKQLLPVDGRPLLQRTLDAVARSKLSPKILVLGGYADQIREQVDTSGFETVINPSFADGQATSLHAGLRALPPSIDGAVVAIGDQPILPPGLLDALADTFDPELHLGARPRYTNGFGSPALIGARLFPEIFALGGDTGGREVFSRHVPEIAVLEIPDRPIPRDVDTWEDYESLLREWSSLGGVDPPRFCQRCGAHLVVTQRFGQLRPNCPSCGYVVFYDPKVAVAVIVEIDGAVVLQQRAADPGQGKWTFPAGFVDRGEAVEDAARREVSEEVGLVIDQLRLVGVYSEAGDPVTLVVYASEVSHQRPVVGDETIDVGMFKPDDLPELAFPRDRRILDDWRRSRRSNAAGPS
jgi:molybdenum cofactor cytidylyltransferase